MTRGARVVAVALAVLASLAGAVAVLGGQVDGNAYVSPLYGYSLAWDDEIWTVEEDVDADDVDYLGLYTEISALRLTGHTDTGGDAATCVEDRETSLLNDPAVTEIAPATDLDVPDTGLDETGEYVIYRYTIESPDGGVEELIAYFECRTVVEGEAVLEVSFITLPRYYAVDLPEVEAVLASLTLPDPDATPVVDHGTPAADDATPAADDATPPADAAGTPVPADDSDADDAYVSPTYAYSLEWDAALWEIEDEQVTAAGRDLLVLDGRVPGPRLYVEGYEGYDGDPVECLAGAAAEIGLEPGSDLEPVTDAAGDSIAGEEEDRAFAAFALTGQTGSDLQAYVDCRVLEGGSAVLVFTFIDAAQDYEDTFPQAQDVIDSLDLGPGPNDATPDAGTPEAPDATAGATPAPADRSGGDNVAMARGNLARTGEMPGPGPADAPSMRWRFAADAAIFASPVVVDGVVYIGEAGSSPETGGIFYAIDAGTGEERWRFDAGGRQVSSAAVADGMVFFGTEEGSVFALDAETGDELWQAAAGGAVTSSPAVAAGVVYVSGGAGLLALNAGSGDEVWTFAAEEVSFHDPVVVDGIVFAGGDTFFFAVDAVSGEELWRSEEGQADFDVAPAVADGRVYLGSENGGVIALDAVTGEALWVVSTGDIVTAPAVSGGTVFVGDDELFYALDADSGNELWTVDVESGIAYASPTVADGVVYLADFGFLYALDAETGDEVWRLASEAAPLTSDPVVVGDVIYVADVDGTLYAFGPTTAGEGGEATPEGAADDVNTIGTPEAD